MEKNILEWVKAILGRRKEDLDNLPSPSAETIDGLIARATGSRQPENPDPPEDREASEVPESSEGSESSEVPESSEGTEASEETDRKNSCPYALRRNIVESLREIRRFAEEHHLASAMVKALLALLADMALDALKGKVSGTALAILLNAMNFDKARSDAFKEGEIAGRNAQIIEKHFPDTTDGLPHFPPTAAGKPTDNIFDIAREA